MAQVSEGTYSNIFILEKSSFSFKYQDNFLKPLFCLLIYIYHILNSISHDFSLNDLYLCLFFKYLRHK